MKKIAILQGKDAKLTFELDELKRAFQAFNIETKVFFQQEPIMEYAPDCVLITSPQDGKLTPFPTYGFINRPRDEYLELPRFLRNILTYDGYLCSSPRLTQMLRDVMFGARKLGSTILKMDFFPEVSPFVAPKLNTDTQKVLIFEPDFKHSVFKTAIYALLDKIPNCQVITFSIDGVKRHNDRFIAVSSLKALDAELSNCSVGICLSGGDQMEKTISPTLLKLLAAGVTTITHGTDELKALFKDSLYYLSPDIHLLQLASIVQEHLTTIAQNPEQAIERARAAHAVIAEQFNIQNLIPAFIEFHEKNLISKGYLPNPDAEKEKALPSVSYIMRTGGKHRPFLERALDCLVDQKYPDLRVIFVTHVKVPFIDEIIAQYPTLKFKVIESIKSRRSEAIRDGMAAVETDLFGLFDDDDELFPNHVRTLVKAMQYHNHRDWRGEIGMVYSGSIHADDTFPVMERIEFQDHKLIESTEKRAIEHFRFYSPAMMSRHEWFMPNGWLARTSVLDEEILEDPVLDTCEDLYFELQIAQRRHFAFSVEMTAVHHFHHLGNSTIDDSHKHVPDTQRIALRNFSRTFAPEYTYDTHYNLVGRVSGYDPNQIFYQDHVTLENKGEYKNQFYPHRYGVSPEPALVTTFSLGTLTRLCLGSLAGVKNVVFMNHYKKKYYFKKFTDAIKKEGVLVTIGKSLAFLSRQSLNGGYVFIPKKRNRYGFFSRIAFKLKSLFHQVLKT